MRVWIVYEVNSHKIVGVFATENGAYEKAGESRAYTYDGEGFEVENAPR